jgi:protease I
MKKKALIVTCTGFRDQEVVYPYYRLQAAGFAVDLVSDKKDDRGRTYGVNNVNMPCTVLLKDFVENSQHYHNEYDFMVLPGGVVALEKLRLFKGVIEFVRQWNQQNKVIASICQGAQILISANCCPGREISGYYNIADDISNAGAKFVDAPAVISQNIISSPHYDFMGEWMEKSLEVYVKLNG